MSHFVNATLSDLRGGRDSWRVILTITIPAFAVAFAGTLVQLAR